MKSKNTDDDSTFTDIDKLRARVNKLVTHRRQKDISHMSPMEMVSLLYEFETSQVELQMQNEELIRIYDELLTASNKYAELYDLAPIGYLSLSTNGIIEQCNLTFAMMLALPKSKIINKAFLDFIAEESQDSYYLAQIELLEKQGKQRIELRLKSPSKAPFWTHFENIYVEALEDKSSSILSVVTNIEQRRTVEDEQRKLSYALGCISSGVFITDLSGKIEYANRKLSDITGYSRSEIIGKTPELFKSGDTADATISELWTTLRAGREWAGEVHNRKKDGSYYWARNFISCIKNPQGKITHYIAIQNDVTLEYELNEQLNYQASHDALTRLINRLEFDRRIVRLLAHEPLENCEHALCYMDLDHFKIINDTCGHFAGDELLRQVSKVLLKAVRNRDTLARLGGDEFGVLMEHCSLEQALRVTKTILREIEDYRFFWQGQSFKIGISIGLVAISDKTRNLTELLKQADAACYSAKHLGRNRVHTYQVDDSEIARQHGDIQWTTRIKDALEFDRFSLYAQAIHQLSPQTSPGNKEVRYELLLRMQDENKGVISPSVFLPAAERYDLMIKIDEWVIEHVFNLLRENPAFVKKMKSISINLSGKSLTDVDFLASIISRLRISGIDASKICFEITETAVISNLNAAIHFISALKALGCCFALDDFGSGLSSFFYLKNLPVEYLKIDGMFVKDILTEPLDKEMVKSMNDIGHVMHMKTVAEFVESADIAAQLKEIGIDYAQGFCFSNPQPFEQLLGN